MLSDLNSALGFFSGDAGTITEERVCMYVWMTPSEKKAQSFVSVIQRSKSG